MELFLIRHTVPKGVQGICYGVSDIEIEDGYLPYFEKIKRYISPDNDMHVISSPLTRCCLLATYLTGGDFVKDNRLRELDFGAWEMQRWDEISRDEIDNWSIDYVHHTTPGNDSLLLLSNRAKQLFEEVKSSSYKRVALVTHAGVIRSLLVYVKGKMLAEAFDFKIDYGSISKIVIEEEMIKVDYENVVPI